MPDDRRLSITSSRDTSLRDLTPDEIARHNFSTVRKGFEPSEVRSFLDSIARRLDSVLARERELQQALEAERERHAAGPPIDEATLTAALGIETGRVLRTAHESASELVSNATAEAERLRSEVATEVEKLRSDTEEVLGARQSQAEAGMADLRHRAQEEVASRLDAARLESEAMVAQSRAECRSMVQEAQELRARVLADLNKRRRGLHSQIEQLRAGREALAETIRGVRHDVDRIAEELFRAEDEARSAAVEAGRQVSVVDAGLEDIGDDLEVPEADISELGDRTTDERVVLLGQRGPASTSTQTLPADDAVVSDGGVAPPIDGGSTASSQTSSPPPQKAAKGRGHVAVIGSNDTGDTAQPKGGTDRSKEADGVSNRRPATMPSPAAAAPSSGTAAPSSGTAAPSPGKDAPSSGTAAPSPGKDAPSPGKAASEAGRTSPVTSSRSAAAAGPRPSVLIFDDIAGSVSGSVEELASEIAVRHESGTGGVPPHTPPPHSPPTVKVRDHSTASQPHAASAPSVTSAPSIVKVEDAATDAEPVAALSAPSRGDTPAGDSAGSQLPVTTDADLLLAASTARSVDDIFARIRADQSMGSESKPGHGSSSGSDIPGNEVDVSQNDKSVPQSAVLQDEKDASDATGSSEPSAGGVQRVLRVAPPPSSRRSTGTMAEPKPPKAPTAPAVPARSSAQTHAEAAPSMGVAPALGAAPGSASPKPLAAPPGTSEVHRAEPDDFEIQVRVDDPRLTKRDEVLVPLMALLSRKLKRALQDDQNAILDRLRSSQGWGEDVLTGADEHIQHFVDAISGVMGQVASAGLAFSGSPASEFSGIVNFKKDLAAAVVLPLRRRLMDAPVDGAGADETALFEHVSSAFREWKGARIERLAGDHAVAVFSAAVLSGVASGVGVEWVVDDDGAQCPDCDDNALAGVVVSGEAFPTGHLHPPAHAGCRCLVAPATA